jgi:mediator of replication checkpoint protein 1
MVSLEREHITPMDIDDASTNPSRSTPIKTASNVLSKLADSDSESETSNAPLPRKTGRGLLSRLQPQSEDSSDSDDQDANEAAFQRTMKRFTTSKVADILSSDDDDDGSGEDAYARMKKQLAAGPSEKSTPEPEKTVPARLVPAAISSDEEDDVPVRASTTRRARPRKERTASPSATPSPSVQSRRSSPGLFCTPNATPVKRRTSTAHVDEHDSDQSTKPTHTADFNERVKRIRAERLAQKEQEKEQAKQARKEKAKTARREADAEPGSDSDGESGRRLTQQAKPTRKAGKKAMEAMVRDQQRIVRSMQLTHQSKTKKRYGTKDLFAKMGYTAGLADSGLPTPDPSSQPASPDVEMDQNDNTLQNPSHEDTTMNDIVDAAMDNLSEPAPANEIASSPPRLNKGKGRAPEFQHLPPNAAMEQLKPLTVQNAQISTKKPTNALMVELSDSEDDLEIVKPKSRFPVFDRLPEKQAQENPSLLHLRHLAQLTLSNDHGPRGKKSMNNTELQISLHRKAREQAQKAREEKLAELRAKGWHIPTEEEREKQQAEVEDMVAQLEKAREHDAKLAKRERAQAKEDGETGDGLLSSDEDEDYVASGEEDAAEDGDLIGGEEEAELEFSGSEDEEAEDQLDDEEENADKPEGLIDEMADEDDEEEAEAEAVSNEPQLDDGDVEDDEPAAPVRNRAVKRGRNLVIDDEDEDDVVGMNGSPTQEATQDDGMAAFGFGNAAPALGLTQAFAGTMASLGSGSQTELPEPEQDSLDFLRSLPDTQPDVNFSSQADFLIPDSQTLESQDGPISNKIDLGISQFFQVPPEFTATQLSEVPEPTQDAGFLLSRSPAGFATMPSTIDTVMMPIAESPIQARKGKLHQRRRETPVELSDVDDMTTSASEAEDEPAFTTKGKDVFSIMKKAAKKQKKVEDFNKQTSWAKDIVEEQAHESEDEYAGLGGASDDESGNEMDEELAKMIDTNDVKVNESELAAYFK